jgi:hypothetical protein
LEFIVGSCKVQVSLSWVQLIKLHVGGDEQGNIFLEYNMTLKKYKDLPFTIFSFQDNTFIEHALVFI